MLCEIQYLVRAASFIFFFFFRTDRFKTLLHLAATSGSTSLLSLLDPLPEDVLTLDSDGCTPLHHAAASSKYDVVKFLASRANGRVRAAQRTAVCRRTPKFWNFLKF